MEDSFKQPEKTLKRSDLWVVLVLIIIGIFIVVGSIFSHIVFSPIGGQNVEMITIPILTTGMAIVIGSLLYPNRKRIKYVVVIV